MSKFKISGNFTNHDWIKLRGNIEIINALTNPDPNELPIEWVSAIEVIENRVKTRFLDPIEKIKNDGVRSGEGFSITLIAVVLMEALAAFEYGRSYKEHKANETRNFIAPCEYLSSARLYKELFKNSQSLKNGTNSDVRDRFYGYIRCGLVHEARTKGTELIISNTSTRNSQPEKYYYKEGKHYIFNRDLFIDRLKEHFNNYLNQLNQPVRLLLRKNLAFKIDEICNIEHNWYFTYGSNLDEEQMNDRLKTLGDFYLHKQLCHIEGYRFVYNKKSKDGSSKGNIEKQNGKIVNGIAYLIKKDTYDKFMEKYEKGYEECELLAHYNDKCFHVKTAISNITTNKLPFKSYRDKVINGAKYQNIDQDYINESLISPTLD